MRTLFFMRIWGYAGISEKIMNKNDISLDWKRFNKYIHRLFVILEEK
jgi:hypothetical protein